MINLIDNKIWRAQAPSNIALIKYMGKTDQSRNLPVNSSISYTLGHLQSIVTLQKIDGPSDRWMPLESDEGRALPRLSLSEKGQARFLKHLMKLKSAFEFDGAFLVRSANDFPSDCGLASSASSFAALTKVALAALSEISGRELPSIAEASEWSRQGSGSSCRSFFAPWAIWTNEGKIHGDSEIGYEGLLHQVVVVDESVKAVSSSEAHVRVSTSSLFLGRPERAENRLKELRQAFIRGDWREAFEITWAEFWDMHALFETSRPSFGYMNHHSLDVLRTVRAATWDAMGDGPLVTMDAGPNVHLLYRNDEAGIEQSRVIGNALSKRYRIVSSEERQ